MSDVVYRAPDRELNLNEGNKSWRENAQSLSTGLCVGGANILRDRVEGEKKTYLQPVNQVLKDGYDGLFSPIF